MANDVPSKRRILFYLICARSIVFLTVLLGTSGHLLHWLLFDSFGRERRRTQRRIQATLNTREDEHYAIIIGAGFSGLGMAIQLQKLGIDDYVILERHTCIGGTWYANTYPGCACDVPSDLYSFSFEPNPNWSYYFSRRTEIAQYLEHCTDKYNLRRHVRFGTHVSELKWLEERQVWQVTTESEGIEKQFYGRFVMAGYGPLSNAAYPSDIPGLDQFQGQMCHTAEWDHQMAFRNKRVAAVGTGASAVQVVPEVYKEGVEQLLIFQRTAPWVVPRADRLVEDWKKRLYARLPIVQKLIRGWMYWTRESDVLAFVYRLPVRFLSQELVKVRLRGQVKDSDLRAKVTPAFDLGCKRVLLSDDWYTTIQKPNVKVIDNRIREVKANSIVTYDGDVYPVDSIIWSTGFQVQKFPLTVYGKDNHSIAEQWADTMQVSSFN